jgi:hypothetical protein
MPVLPTTVPLEAENSLTLGRALEKFTSADRMLSLQPSTHMRLWEWREDKINLIGPHKIYITLRVRSEKVLETQVPGTDPVQIRSATDAPASARALSSRCSAQHAREP